MLQLPTFVPSLGRRARFAAIVVPLLMLAAALPPAAHAADPYRVGGVKVTAKGKTPGAAKSRAVREGRRVALQRLLRRITGPADYKRLSAIRWRGIEQLLTGYEVEHERNVGNTYEGVLAYRFDRAKVRTWLQGQSVTVIDAASRPVLILPVWQAKRGPLLWDDPNPWREAWANLDPPNGLVPVVTGTGELADLQAIDGRQAVAGDMAALAAIAKRYQAGSVVVAVAAPAGKGVRITLRRYFMPAGAVRQLGTVSARDNPAALKTAAERIVATLEASWKRSNSIDSGATQTLRVAAPLDGLAYWTKLRARLDSVPLIKRYRVVQFATNQSILDLVHAGSVDQLKEALVEAGLDLRPGAAPDAWVLRLAAAPSTPGASATPAAPATRSAPPPPASPSTPPPPRRSNDRRP